MQIFHMYDKAIHKPYISPPMLPYLTKPIQKEQPQPELGHVTCFNTFYKLFKKSKYFSQYEQTIV